MNAIVNKLLLAGDKFTPEMRLKQPVNKVYRYFEEINKNKYLALVPTNESKEIIKKYEELWSKIRDLIRSITKNSDYYDEKYMKIKFNSDDELPLNKTTA